MLSSSQTGMIDEFWLGDAAGEPIVSLGEVTGPSWLDEETLLLVDGRVDAEQGSFGKTTLLQVAVEDGQVFGRGSVLLTSEDVNAFFTQQGIDHEFAIGWVVSENGSIDDHLLIFALQVDEEIPHFTGYMLEYNLVSGRLDWVEPLAQHQLLSNIQYSPDGRYLLASARSIVPTLLLLDMETGEVQSYNAPYPWYGFSWSADGNWLVIAGEEGLSLIAPSANFERKVFYTMTDCQTAVWVNRTN